MVSKKDLVRVSEFLWEIPKSYRADMRVPARVYASERLLDAILGDKSIEQLVNVATLPGIQKYALAMPDIHQGYGFPIGGVAATALPDGVISPGGIGYDINCLTGDARILHADGYTRPIAEMAASWQAARLVVYDEETGTQSWTPVVRFLRRRPAHPVLRVRTAGGHEICATADHPFYTPDGMRELRALSVGDRVAVYAFEGVPYEEPDDEVLVTESDIRRVLSELGKSQTAIFQAVNHLKRRGLLPLRRSSPHMPALLRLLGYIFGDGSISFANRRQRGHISFYGKAEDLRRIRDDIAQLGFSATLYARHRRHCVETEYDTYTFERRETSLHVGSTALAALLVALGAPVGRKSAQEYTVPRWLFDAPLWHVRLFLAALFGAELSAPAPMSGHGRTFAAPALSMNKHEGFVESGRRFLEGIATLLAQFGVRTWPVAQRATRPTKDGRPVYRLLLNVANDTDSLLALWSRVGYEYNRERQALAVIAVQYIRLKAATIEKRERAAARAAELHAAGVPVAAIEAELADMNVNRRFIERSVYGERVGSVRIGDAFPTFEEFLKEATAGLGQSGLVWDVVEAIEPLDDFDGEVYDFTVAHEAHNFVANAFVVSNCGVRLLASHLDEDEIRPYLDELATKLFQYCPSGVGRGGHYPLSNAELDKVAVEGAEWCLKKGLARPEDLERTEEGGRLEGADPGKVSKQARQRGREQLGTLGAGNHFLEVDVVREVYYPEAADAMGLRPGQVVVLIHCGSRGFGHQIATDYIREFQKAVHKYGIVLPDRELVCAPLSTPEGQNYLAAMRCAANFAFANRQVLAHQVRRTFEEVLGRHGLPFDLDQVYDLAHNIGKIEWHETDGARKQVCVHRKGATRSFGPGHPDVPAVYRHVGQPVLVPGSMGTASYVLVGTEQAMVATFGSSCHGAGRQMSRRKAKKSIKGATLREQLEARGIVVRAGSMKGLAEEAPFAYKDVEAVVDVVEAAGIARKVVRVEPIAVIKG